MIETDVQRLVFQRGGVALCSFRCPADHERWSRENQIQDGHNVAFPKAWVEIEPAGIPAFVADPNQVVYYNYGDCFRRRLVRDEGDAANVLLFDSDIVTRALAAYDSSVVERPQTPFRYRNGPVSPALYLRQHQLFEYAHKPRADPAQVEEKALGILDEVLVSTYRARAGRRPRTSNERHRDRVETIKQFLSTRFAEPIGLEEIAAEVELSVYHMCRIFRRETGLPVYRYLRRLRLRTALEWLVDSDRPLAELALDAGFAHQSHFTEAFRQEFGMPPGALRSKHRSTSGILGEKSD